jgi:transcriptional regulator with XRE-family HTH domain
MTPSFEMLAEQVKIHREHKGYSQSQIEEKLPGVSRTSVALLEQAYRLPSKEQIVRICEFLDMPKAYWQSFLSDDAILRLGFEITLKELVGIPVSALNLDSTVIENVQKEISRLFKELLTPEQSFDKFNSILVFYGIKPVTREFFRKYLGNEQFNSLHEFEQAIKKYLADALRLFSSIQEAYEQLNSGRLQELLKQLQVQDTAHFSQRTTWDRIENIPEEKLEVLGYIAAAKVEKEQTERNEIVAFLNDVIQKKKSGRFKIEDYSIKKRRRIDSLLRTYESRIEHGLFSPLFQPDIDALEREVKRIAPKEEGEIAEIKKFQGVAYENLANYLTADFMDVYVATSMRNSADFVSVNRFVQNLFQNTDIRQYKLRYFNPTQSWIEDRVAKGLVEALMLKRANICIYMAQKEDTFGKDSEASVSLGQGKPVIVYVPKIFHAESGIDSEKFGQFSKNDLIELIKKYDKTVLQDIDEDVDDQEAIHGILLHTLFKKLTDYQFAEVVIDHWADFDLYGEVDERFNKEKEEDLRNRIKELLDKLIKQKISPEANLDADIRTALTKALIARALRFERRAKIFREVHPLALQVILSTGVLNGILVVRSADSCARLLKNLIENRLDLDLDIDENNYRLIERSTKSTIRVISRHKLISNAFLTFYKQLY